MNRRQRAWDIIYAKSEGNTKWGDSWKSETLSLCCQSKLPFLLQRNTAASVAVAPDQGSKNQTSVCRTLPLPYAFQSSKISQTRWKHWFFFFWNFINTIKREETGRHREEIKSTRASDWLGMKVRKSRRGCSAAPTRTAERPVQAGSGAHSP